MPATAKQKLRGEMRRMRDALSQAARADAARALAAHGTAPSGFDSGAAVAGYASMPGEIDPSFLLERLHGGGHPLCLPVVEAPEAPLIFRRWHPGDALELGLMGVRVPAQTQAQIAPQIVLVPLLAFDREGYRLGLGGGFYDRTLEALRAKGPLVAIGVAFDEQEVEAVPHDVHDQRLDRIITPSAAITVKP